MKPGIRAVGTDGENAYDTVFPPAEAAEYSFTVGAGIEELGAEAVGVVHRNRIDRQRVAVA